MSNENMNNVEIVFWGSEDETRIHIAVSDTELAFLKRLQDMIEKANTRPYQPVLIVRPESSLDGKS